MMRGEIHLINEFQIVLDKMLKVSHIPSRVIYII